MTLSSLPTVRSDPKFSDVPLEAWYLNDVLSVSNAGIMNGENNLFRPNENMTRAEMSVVINNLINLLDNKKNDAITLSNKNDKSEEQKTIAAIKKNSKSLVKIMFPNFSGSGFYVDLNHIITVNHIVEDSEPVVILSNGEAIIGKVVKRNVDHDLTLIEVKNAGVPVIFQSSISVGQTVITMGNPVGLSNASSKGMVSAINKDDLSQTQVQVSINHGDSGGMLLNLDGEVIGMIASKLDDYGEGESVIRVEQIGFATRVEEIREFIKN